MYNDKKILGIQCSHANRLVLAEFTLIACEVDCSRAFPNSCSVVPVFRVSCVTVDAFFSNQISLQKSTFVLAVMDIRWTFI